MVDRTLEKYRYKFHKEMSELFRQASECTKTVFEIEIPQAHEEVCDENEIKKECKKNDR